MLEVKGSLSNEVLPRIAQKVTKPAYISGTEYYNIYYACGKGSVRGALVRLGCYQHRYEWKGLWCSSIIW